MAKRSDAGTTGLDDSDTAGALVLACKICTVSNPTTLRVSGFIKMEG
jgi:hypothetical protein